MGVIVIGVSHIGTVKVHDVLGEHLGILCLGKIQEATKLSLLGIIGIPAGELPLLCANLSGTDLSLNRSLRDNTSDGIHTGFTLSTGFSKNGDCHRLFRSEGMGFKNREAHDKGEKKFFHVSHYSKRVIYFCIPVKPPSLHSDERFREQQPTLRRR
jgi:hypothetical protein